MKIRPAVAEAGRFEVYTARFPEFTDRRQVSLNSGMQPRWRQDGKQIVYLSRTAS